MRIQKLKVQGLFGVFDHEIKFNAAERITIIHGPNGYGKTAILKLLNSLFGLHLGLLARIPFDYAEISLDDEGRILIDKRQNEFQLFPSKEDAQLSMVLSYQPPNGNKETFPFTRRSGKEVNFPLEMIDHNIPELTRIERTKWVHDVTGRVYNLDEILDMYGHMFPPLQARQVPDWLKNLVAKLDVRLIEAQRLVNISQFVPSPRGQYSPSLDLRPAVALCAQNLVALIQEKQAEYGAHSQALDSTFPARVLKKQLAPTIQVDELREKLNDVELKRERISQTGLLSLEEKITTFTLTPSVDEATKNILSLYIADVEQKLGVFQDITKKIEILQRLINARFSYKKLVIDKQSGFIFKSRNGVLLPGDLSSGEQHELVLFYELLFKTKANSLVLIDEPELSLHVDWQMQFLQDLTEIANVSSFDVLVATHSPSIINDRWDLTVALKGPEE
jgi:predicted ATP-binding protein involved in virulence